MSGSMKRLTTNKDVSEMGMFELAHNSCYAKDGKARFRNYDTDIDARELTRNLLETLADDAFIDNSDETFDNVIADYLQYGTSELVGLIAIFYQQIWAMTDLRERLKEYEDLEEQGKLKKLPCKIGDTIYVIPSKANYGLNIVNRHKENNRVYEQIVDHIRFYRSGYLLSTCEGQACVVEESYKETWFLIKEEAETALKELKDVWKELEGVQNT